MDNNFPTIRNRHQTAPAGSRIDINFDDNYQDKKEFISSFFDGMLSLNVSLTNKSLFNILIINEGKKVLMKENVFSKENTINKFEKFINIYKYYSLIIVPLSFLSKDDNLYKFKVDKVKELFTHFIQVSLLSIGNLINISNRFKDILNERLKIKNQNIIPITKNLMKITVDQKNEYIYIKKAIHQLLDDCQNLELNTIINAVKNTILFCFFNKSPVNINNEDDDDKELIPKIPFITKRLEKKFCLVLDLDETLTHNNILSFGNYFMLRPGVIEFLTKVSINFEIIIFTSSAKSYANNILNKIDPLKKFISYRLYKKHTLFEGGKTIKDLSKIGRDLKKIIMVDNLRTNAKYQLENLYLIKTWTDDVMDKELEILGNFLETIVNAGKYDNDIRKGLNVIK
jgi:Dullard-like phosphatase family protein